MSSTSPLDSAHQQHHRILRSGRVVRLHTSHRISSSSSALSESSPSSCCCPSNQIERSADETCNCSGTGDHHHEEEMSTSTQNKRELSLDLVAHPLSQHEALMGAMAEEGDSAITPAADKAPSSVIHSPEASVFPEHEEPANLNSESLFEPPIVNVDQEDALSTSSAPSSSSSTSSSSLDHVSMGSLECDPATKELRQQQAILRKRIISIQQSTTYSSAEKAKMVQALISSQWNDRQKDHENDQKYQACNKLMHKNSDFALVCEADRQITYHDFPNGILGCKHYQRSAKLQSHCCGKWYTCRFCHDEVSDHTITRNLTKTMMCMLCSHVQPAAQHCINPDCQAKVAKYYCDVCKLWDNDPKKNIYHCHECGICRIGKGLDNDYFHCKKCNVCMAITLKGKHKCIERNLESDCPICGEYMFTSTSTVIFMPCGHCIHHKCHQEYIQTSYQCPTCSKSLANMTEYFKRIDLMLATHQMPAEYANMQSLVYCNDCEKKSITKYHFLYHKCAHCRGYNTKVIKTSDLGELMMGGGVASPTNDLSAELQQSPSVSPELEVNFSVEHQTSGSRIEVTAGGSGSSVDLMSLPSQNRNH